MSSSVVLGQFLWHELLTPDPAAGAGFYSKVFGWSASPWEGNVDYTMLAGEKGPVGGARVVGKDPLADKVAPQWLTYVGVPDLSAALAEAESQGATVIHPITGVSADGGRYAVITDPQGATIGVYEPGAAMAQGATGPMDGPDQWHELTAEDPVAALEFYKTIFGWDVVASHQMGGEVGTYYLFGKGTTQMGGAYIRGKSVAANWPRWLVYLKVPSVTAAVAAVTAAGGKVLNGPHQVPGGGWIAQVLDSHGVAMAVLGPKEAAAAAPKAPAKPKAKAAAKPKAAVKPAPAAEKPKAAVKAKTKTKTKPKTKPKTKAKAKPKAKVQPKVKAKAKSKPKAKVAVKAKRPASTVKAKAKTVAKAKKKSKSKARKAPRKGK